MPGETIRVWNDRAGHHVIQAIAAEVEPMKRDYFSMEQDGFYGAYYENPIRTDRCMIALLGDSIDDHMAVSGVKYLHRTGCNVMTMFPAKKADAKTDF